MDSVKKTVVKALESYKGLQLTVSVNGFWGGNGRFFIALRGLGYSNIIFSGKFAHFSGIQMIDVVGESL
jgi:hypothetical protein